ncbi:PREDICTED: uncharacterized protein LOC106810343 [Priapulus caudatus]|uniref:Uncharacterized protein LOC106810343 n=1 Tax=Priapulus caudatus TaxID=37621 RepID=A0ABM1EAC1_PRICU|nr:PREDICTED: uncharacterized protein LOC106810343 [Priapulus caudatus]XP_014669143.1 PREDICTED: uncharacterized protein LOC106810343 [Priapulus caudatus]
MGYRMCTGLVSLCLFLATASAVVAFFVDFWGEFVFANVVHGGTFGLWRVCPVRLTHKTCDWIHKDLPNLDRLNGIPNWFLACEIMFTISTGSLVFCLILLPFYGCLCSKGGGCFNFMGRMIYSTLVLAALVMGVGLLVFGLEVHLGDREVILGKTVHGLEWAFWLMVGSWAMTAISVSVMFLAHRRALD